MKPEMVDHAGTPGQRARRTLVIVPTYDEVDNLPVIVERINQAEPAVDILVVDDSSPDGTGEVADQLAIADPQRVFVMHRTAKDGLGAAYLAGFAWGLERGYSLIVETDADGSHPPEQLGRLIAAIDRGADVSIGSRYVAGGKVVNWPLRRKILSRSANTYARFMLGVDIKDITAGYRIYRREVLEAIGLSDVASVGYCFQVDLTWRSWCHGFRIAEVPITFVERERGVSKMDRSTIWEAVTMVARWGMRHRLAPRGRPASEALATPNA